ncbi:hypothetical protein E4O04_01450 [Treponema sp. OMZ 799]|uniref:hypothetical protein n=1 Tax=unclassified Treponema TaxID=2638727 RepID=UPI0020A59A4F|nr:MULTISPECIES: hypothetical protein [unclassified Treponema]UTC76749.1 hypothetical protein E4O04_01450 [Treponema sp. OMZ 799]UTC81295.1 hypothetical protein E4O07_11925 [Treponema sp. OMZ 798]
MEKDNTVKWNKNYIELHSEENGCRYCTCKTETYFDPDSDEKVVNHYIDFFFDIIEEKKNQHTPPQSIGVCCSHKVVAVGFNTLCYDAERRGIKPSARIKQK